MAAAQAAAGFKKDRTPVNPTKPKAAPAESEKGITPNNIDMVMEHTSCSRNDAIKALRESNDDMINAVMKLSGN